MNKIYTLSYFRKRLLNNNYSSKILIKKYAENDLRKWSISIFDDKKIFCTCLKPVDGMSAFIFDDALQYVKGINTIKTCSMQVIFEFLEKIKDKQHVEKTNDINTINN